MRAGSLCTGYGGLDLAVGAVTGGELAFVADVDPGACALLAHRFPGVPNLGDIKAVDWLSLGAVDILAGGYPCQPFSAAGRRLGTDDERHLWPYIAKGIGILRPPLVVLENVQGHLTLGFDIVLADLAGLGYDAEWVMVTASAAGACHRRARLFILAFPAMARAVAGAPVAVIEDGTWLEPRESLFGMLPFTGRVPASGSMACGRVHAAEDGPTVAGAGLLPTPRVQTHGGGAAADPPGRVRSAENPDGHSPNLMTAVTLLKTPTAQLAINGGSQHPDKRRAGGHGPTLADQVEHELLPTPTAREKGGRNARHGDTGHGDDLPEAIRYLPTPMAEDAHHRGRGASPRRAARRQAEGHQLTVEEAVQLLPTPRATDGEKGGPNQRGSSGDLMLPSAVMQLLPTPSVADGTGGHKTRSGDRKGEPLLGGIGMLLPTPTAQDSANARNATANRSPGSAHHAGTTLCDVFHGGGAMPPTPTVSGSHGTDRRSDGSLLLPGVAREVGTDWGPYEAAIRRWETVAGRPAPRPTVPGKTGERLNPALPEWMMGLPSGWITEVPGLSRNAMLKLAGNGVVPQQAELALRLLLDRAGIESLGRAA